ncbi:MAG: DUF4157 domain-containing protein [Myxococcota bacterium]|nr:DUF4157 domain-containing protein [Myxococcota bacterium]
MKDLEQRSTAVTHDQPKPIGMPPPQAVNTANEPAWAGSPETAHAKESVRREATAKLPDEQVDALATEINVATPSEIMAREGAEVVGPEVIAEMQADEQSQQLRRRAIGDAYQVVMAGAAAANGQPQAQHAIEGAAPELREAAQSVAKAPSGGAPLPDDVRLKMEAQFGEDFSNVQIHTNSGDVGALGAGAAAKGEHIHFAAGLDPTSESGRKLIAHELTHVVQQRGAGVSGKPKVAASSSAAEQEAEAVADKVAKPGEEGGDAKVQVARGTAAADHVHLGEATVHKGIELEAAGVDGKIDPKNLTPQQKAALEMYSGNFMRDYSQLAAPTPLKILSGLPSTNAGGKVGNAGARSLMDAIVKSIAILELGKDIGNLVTQKNVGAYEAEQHLDNPIGTSGANDFITEGANPKLAASPEFKAIATTDARHAPVVAGNSTPDVATQQTHAGSAVPGLQYENPELYKVGAGGLANHLANSTEHSKDCLLQAVANGATPTGRMKAGMAQHGVEDYFSHSNFIEVGLNHYINDALKARKDKQPSKKSEGVNSFIDEFADANGTLKEGATSVQGETKAADPAKGVHAEFSFVDTLYDQKTGSGKQAVTTGTFGGTDSQVSLGHVLLPKLPVIEQALHKGVDSTFGIVEIAAKEKKKPTWQHIQTALDESGPEGAAAKVLLEASKSIGLAVPCPSGFHLTYQQVGIPLFGSMSVPNGADFDYTNVAIADALVMGASTYVDVMERLESLKKSAGIVGLSDVIFKIQDKIRMVMQKMFAAIKAKVTELIRQIIIDMYKIDPKAAGHAGVGELTHIAERQMHEKTKQTSVESRLQKGGDLYDLSKMKAGKAELERRVGPVRAKDPGQPEDTWGTPANPWVTVHALPPSHSEISKDHPPHHHDDKHPEWHAPSAEQTKLHGDVEKKLDEHHDPKNEHHEHDHEDEDLAEGSSFYGLHQVLAVEADRHIQKQLETCWKAQLIPGQNADDKKMQVGHDAVLAEAKTAAGWASKQREQAGFRHAQSDERVPAELRNRPEVMALLDLVDYFVSHPASSTWWRTIFDNYIATHGEEVHHAILARNKTRSLRKPAG